MSRRLFFRLLSAATPSGDHVPDAELLRRFTTTGDPAAFELLVRRHADAVWAAGLRVLRNSTDAEDVFQSVFLVLARKAGSIRGACVGGWLHRVAVNAALKLRASRGRERPEGEALRSLTPPARPEAESAELAAVVHQELARLPDRYRLPVVLCDLEGQTHAEAAKVLGWPVGSVSGRLSRARDILRDRLTRRGLAPGVVMGVALAAGSAPAALVGASVAAACGTASVSPVVSSLTAGVISAMRVAKLKLTAAVVAVGMLGLAGVGTVYALTRVPVPVAQVPGDPPQLPEPKAQPPAKDKDPNALTAFPNLDVKSLEDLVAKCPNLFSKDDEPTDPKDDTARRLLKAMANNARAELRLVMKRVEVGRLNDPRELIEAAERVIAAVAGLDAGRELPSAEERVRMLKWYEKIAETRVEVGTAAPDQLHRARYARLNAELALHKAGGKGGAK